MEHRKITAKDTILFCENKENTLYTFEKYKILLFGWMNY